MSDDRLKQERHMTATSTCPTGKRCYINRRTAKGEAVFARKTGVRGMRPYQCPTCGQWHVGHKPAVVVRGHVSAADWYSQ